MKRSSTTWIYRSVAIATFAVAAALHVRIEVVLLIWAVLAAGNALRGARAGAAGREWLAVALVVGVGAGLGFLLKGVAHSVAVFTALGVGVILMLRATGDLDHLLRGRGQLGERPRRS
jgi:hypothetical protein